MKPTALFAVILSALVLLPGCHKATHQDSVISVDSDDADMKAAMDRARAEVDAVIQKLQGGEIEGMSVKVPIKDGGETEHFWLNTVTFQAGTFTGTVDNDPETVHNVKLGDKVSVKKDEISDWLYMKDGKMHGNYTLRVLFKQMPPDEVAKYKRLLAE